MGHRRSILSPFQILICLIFRLIRWISTALPTLQMWKPSNIVARDRENRAGVQSFAVKNGASASFSV